MEQMISPQSSTPPRSPLLPVIVAVVTGVVLIGLALYFSAPFLTSLFSAEEPVSEETGVVAASVSYPDMQWLALLAEEEGGFAGYLGRADGTFEQMTPLPEGGRIMSVAQEGERILVLGRDGSGAGSTLYEYRNGEYYPRYHDTGLLGSLGVSRDGGHAGFVRKENGGSAYVLSLTDVSSEPVSLGAADAVRFFGYEGTAGVWLVGTSTPEAKIFTGGVWRDVTDAKIVYEEAWKPEPETTSAGRETSLFVTNGDARAAYYDASLGGVVELQITSLAPFTITATTLYRTSMFTQIFFKGDELTAVTPLFENTGGVVTRVITYPLAAPDERTSYAIGESVSGVTQLFFRAP